MPSSDWPAIAKKHHAHPVFRALETGAVFAKSEYSLNSSIVDGYGRIAASAVSPEGSKAVLVADVPLRNGTPLAARLGDWVGWLCVAGAVTRMLWGLLSGWRERTRTSGSYEIQPFSTDSKTSQPVR